ncbi:MAG: hypothetical protein KGO81_10815 [Bacteroidota bacterium]|nr:hypothetical protein [Bacteroidota bacterium]
MADNFVASNCWTHFLGLHILILHFMTRDANLYILSDKDWRPLADLFKSHKDYNLKHQVSIYQLMTSTSVGHHYAILTLSDKADEIVEEYGATPASEKNYLRITLHDYHGDTLFGDKSNVVFLNKFY